MRFGRNFIARELIKLLFFPLKFRNMMSGESESLGRGSIQMNVIAFDHTFVARNYQSIIALRATEI